MINILLLLAVTLLGGYAIFKNEPKLSFKVSSILVIVLLVREASITVYAHYFLEIPTASETLAAHFVDGAIMVLHQSYATLLVTTPIYILLFLLCLRGFRRHRDIVD